MPTLVTPHDTLFKALFSHPGRAAEVLRAMLPAHVARLIDWSTLTPKQGSFIDDEMRGSHADLLFSAEMLGRVIQIYLLFEHQSTHDRKMPRRLLRYMDRIWDHFTRPDEDEPFILPVVLYHGEKPWPGPIDFHGMCGAPPELAPYIPQFQFVLVDLTALDPVVLREWTMSACSRLALRLLQASRSPELFDALMHELHDLVLRIMAEPFEDGAFLVILRYILETRGIDTYDRTIQVITEIEKQHRETTMETIADRLRSEGRTEGLTEGRSEGRTKGLTEGKRNTILDLIQLRHGEVPDPVRTLIEAADDDELKLWLARVVRSSTAADLLTPG